MNKQNLELFNLTEGATKEEITQAYETLRAKYLEERFMDGEAGNNAAKMLTKIETAYSELMSEISQSETCEGGDSAFSKVEELIRSGNLTDAQRQLDLFNERGGQWHYLQSVVFYRKNWVNESKKQLEIAIQLEPENEKYREAYKKLNDKINFDSRNNSGAGQQSVYEGQRVENTQPEDQMGGNFCANCIQCCYINLCINLLCSGCCR
jgi:DnaJ-class molecular chaperone